MTQWTPDTLLAELRRQTECVADMYKRQPDVLENRIQFISDQLGILGWGVGRLLAMLSERDAAASEPPR